MFGARQVEEFLRAGIVRLEGAFGADEAAAMRQAVWEALGRRTGAREDDPSTWPPGPAWKLLEAKRSRRFAPVLGPALAAAADALLDGRPWKAGRDFGQLLVTFPHADRWYLPSRIWHVDFGYDIDPSLLPAVHAFALFGDLPPGSGGTLLVSGSHRSVASWVAAHPEQREARPAAVRDAFNRHHPWWRELTSGPVDAPDRIERYMGGDGDVDGVALRVVEVCGRAGDVFVCHPWTVHTPAPSAGPVPRLIRHVALRVSAGPVGPDSPPR